MADKLDPELSQWFATAQQPLPGDEFESRLAAQLNRSRSWTGDYSPSSLLRAGLAGIATGILTPFRLRSGYATVIAVIMVMLIAWIGV